MASPSAEGAAGAAVVHEGERVRIDGRLDFETARDTLGRVSAAIEGAPSALVVDLAGVTRANSAGLALMIEWLGVARRAGREVRFANVPEGLRQLARVCQVDRMLDAATV